MEFASNICCVVGLWEVGEGGEEADDAMRDIEELLLSGGAAMSFLLESCKLVLSWMLLNDAAWEQFEVLNNSTSAAINSSDDDDDDSDA